MSSDLLDSRGKSSILDQMFVDVDRKAFHEVYDSRKAAAPPPETQRSGAQDQNPAAAKVQDRLPAEPKLPAPKPPESTARGKPPESTAPLQRPPDSAAKQPPPLSPGYYVAPHKLAATRLGPGDTRFTNTSDKMTRDFEVHLPPGYSDVRPVPMFYVMGGVSESIESLKQDSHLNQIADKDGFGVVYLQAQPKIFGLNSWSLDHGALSEKAYNYNDLRYVRKVHAQVEAMVSSIPNKEYIIGHSEGGDAAQFIARSMPGVFAGVGGIKSTRQDTDPLPRRDDPTAAMFVLGEQDPVLPFRGGTEIVPIAIAANNIVRSRPYLQAPVWAKANGCVHPVTRDDGYDRVTKYSCKLAPVEQIIRHGGGHHWNDEYSRRDTARQVVDFLLSFEKPGK